MCYDCNRFSRFYVNYVRYIKLITLILNNCRFVSSCPDEFNLKISSVDASKSPNSQLWRPMNIHLIAKKHGSIVNVLTRGEIHSCRAKKKKKKQEKLLNRKNCLNSMWRAPERAYRNIGVCQICYKYLECSVYITFGIEYRTFWQEKRM